MLVHVDRQANQMQRRRSVYWLQERVFAYYRSSRKLRAGWAEALRGSSLFRSSLPNLRPWLRNQAVHKRNSSRAALGLAKHVYQVARSLMGATSEFVVAPDQKWWDASTTAIVTGGKPSKLSPTLATACSVQLATA